MTTELQVCVVKRKEEAQNILTLRLIMLYIYIYIYIYIYMTLVA